MLSKIKDGARAAATSIGEKIEDIAPEKTAQFNSAKEKITDQANATLVAVKEKAKDQASSLKDKAKEQATALKGQAGDMAVNKINALTSHLLKKVVVPKLSASLGDDPDMPQAVRDGIAFAVEEFMDEVEITLHEAVEMKIKGTTSSMKDKIFAEPYTCCSPNPVLWLRAQILYTLFPHDKSIWANLRSPIWWLIKIISVFPMYYAATIFWAVIWLLKSKRDEYQLINFIVELKKAHFISYGILGSVLGNVAFLQCVVVHPHQNPHMYAYTNDTLQQPDLPCTTTGPGLNMPFWPTALIFLLQIVLTWASAAFLPCSQRLGDRGNEARKKERKQKQVLRLRASGLHQEADELEQENIQMSKTLRLKYWLMYDSVCCVIIVALCAYAYASSNFEEDPDGDGIPTLLHTTMWWSRILYGLLCGPWFLLQGFLYPLVLHTKSTAYNAKGQVVPLANAEERKVSWNKRHPKRVIPM